MLTIRHYSSAARPEISAGERLSVGLRYLATGNSQVNMAVCNRWTGLLDWNTGTTFNPNFNIIQFPVVTTNNEGTEVQTLGVIRIDLRIQLSMF